MKTSLSLLCILLAGALGAAASLPQGDSIPPQAPRPTMHHQTLRGFVGSWDTLTKCPGGPGIPAFESKGTSKFTQGPGDLWVVENFKGEFMKKPFDGMALVGYDTEKQHHVIVWADEMATGYHFGEAQCENDCKKQSGWIEGPGPDGKTRKCDYTLERKDDKHFVLTIAPTGDAAKAGPTVIEYTKK